MPRPGNEPVELTGKLVAIGNNAILLDFDSEQKWIPLSAFHEDNEVDFEEQEIGATVDVVIKEWLAIKEGLV